ncbi:small RNA degrading nuclease 5-like [Papaver somniferum]|uniref:small RNA degrading nuclease 5-like n=1 Tax=Papaver somniferum TaxID=3469 RepID=UPI000E6F89B8|nr:small RNA degrading nuclease 5-like [Papaver somniferum]
MGQVKSTRMLSVDCEMVLCEDKTESLVQVCVVNRNLEVKLNELVKLDKPVLDYRTQIHGINAKDLERATCSLEDIQKSMKKLLSDGVVLIGHSLDKDLKALKVDHSRVIDTSLIFKYPEGHTHKRPSLNHLCKIVGADRGMHFTYLCGVRMHAQAFITLVDMEEKRGDDDASQRVEIPQGNETSSQPIARAEQLAARLKKRKTKSVKLLGESQLNFPARDDVIILDSDADEPGHPRNPAEKAFEEDAAVVDESEESFGVDAETAVRDVGEAAMAYAVTVVEVGVGQEAKTVVAEAVSGWDVGVVVTAASSEWNVCCPKDYWGKCLKGV